MRNLVRRSQKPAQFGEHRYCATTTATPLKQFTNSGAAKAGCHHAANPFTIHSSDSLLILDT